MSVKNYVCGIAAIMAIAVGLARASEVTVPYQGITLNANLELAAGKTPADGVILITHGGLVHRGMELYVYLQKLLKDHGYNTLAINLSLSLDNRHGTYDCKTTHRHRVADAADEIGAWVGWLQAQGAQQVVLLGHSRGAGQTALYAAQRDNALIKAVVLMAPDTRETNGAAVYQQRYQKSLGEVLQKAQSLEEAGKGNTVLEHTDFLYCPDTSAAADTFISYYGPDPSLDTPSLIPKSNRQTLVLVAGNDEVVVGFKEKMLSFADHEHIHVEVIDGADHFFRDLYTDDAVDAIDDFLKRVGY
jgi:pimeloyl-ACP methyl ester carboxylesterase